MGIASDRAREILERPLTSQELAVRREADRELVRPVATLDGDIVDQPAPQASPVPVMPRQTVGWD